jgi:hypothetical protein
MTQKQIAELQARIGTTPDGFWGPKSIAACQKHLRSLMPKPNPWPGQSQAELKAFYGDPWDNKPIIRIPAPSWMRTYDTDKPWKEIECHRKVAGSLIRALESAYKLAPNVVKRMFGCHVDRNMRNGGLPSLHAYGAAIDLAASTNGNLTHWPLRATMPIEVMECFAIEGWLAAGAFWLRDSMHFQATR